MISVIAMTLASISLLVGCGTQIALSGRTYDDYQKSIKPYIAYWEKAGMTEEERKQDWVACGGNERGTFSWKVKQQLPGESNETARIRQERAFERCMIRAGYHYTGNCSSEDMKSEPMCGAP